MSTKTFTVAMTCGGCAGAVQRVLKKAGYDEGSFAIDLGEQTVTVTSDAAAADIEAVLKKSGKAVSFVSEK